MKFMVRKREERADKGKDTTFFHRSTAVPTERIEKYEKKQTGETLPDVCRLLLTSTFTFRSFL
jgi:hypothetical protein